MDFKIGTPLKLSLDTNEQIGINFQWISKGSFMMGSPIDEPWRDNYSSDLPREVEVKHGFWISTTPVTQEQWTSIAEPQFELEISDREKPIVDIDWYQAISFCDELNQRFSDSLPNKHMFALPTNVQWEYACRSGTQTIFYSGDTQESLDKIAWFSANSNKELKSVGLKEPNTWGLYDMIGNVQEWVSDETHIAVSSNDAHQGFLNNNAIFLRGYHDERIQHTRSGGFAWDIETGAFNCSQYAEADATHKSDDLGFRVCIGYVISE
ncbi:MAG: formylglycine-generating enzyme family protein [Chloroflexota bacterium]